MRQLTRTLSLALIISLLSGPARAQQKSADTKEENALYRIGAILPLTGAAASWGDYTRKGLELAFADLSEAERKRLKVIYEDDQMQARRSVSAFKRLNDIQAINAVLVIGSAMGNAVCPLAERAGKICIAIGASDRTIAAGKKYSYTHWVSPEAEAQLLVEMIQKLDYRRIGVLSNEQQGNIAQIEAFLAELKKQEIADRVVFEQRVLVGVTDFNTIISKLRMKKVDGVLAAMITGSVAAFAKQARDLSLDAQIFGVETFEDEHEVQASDGALIGKWYVTTSAPKKEFAEEFKARYGTEPAFTAVNAYDTLRLLARGTTQFRKNNEKIAEYLSTLKDFEGAAGTYSATGDNRFDLPAAAKKITRDGFVPFSVPSK